VITVGHGDEMVAAYNERGYQLRTIGMGHRLDGMSDLLSRANGCSVFDIGCNRGRVAYEFERYGATTLHGCDNYEDGMFVANEWFADLRGVNARFEVVDLKEGPEAVDKAFGKDFLAQYDFVLMLAVYHKLSRIMTKVQLFRLVEFFALHTAQYFVWRGSESERYEFQHLLKDFELVHWSNLSVIEFDGKPMPQPCAVWKRK
jgi:SAM-dependent methyltransferase